MARQYDSVDGLYPTESIAKQCQVDSFLDWCCARLKISTERALELVTEFVPTKGLRLGKGLRRRSVNMEEVGSAFKLYLSDLKVLEETFLATNAYVTGESLTIADLVACCLLEYSRVLDVDFAAFPRVEKWREEVKSHLECWASGHQEFERFVEHCEEQKKIQKARERNVKKHGKDATGGNRAPDVCQTVYFQKPATEVFASLTDAGVFTEMTAMECEINCKPGGTFRFGDVVSGANLYIDPDGRKLLQSWRAAEWPANKFSTVRISVDVADNGTQLTLTQQDVPQSFVKKTDLLWNVQFWRKLGGVLVRNILQQVLFENISPHTVYQVFTDSQAAARLTRSKCDVGRGVGSTFSYLDGAITGKMTQLITDVKILQDWRCSDWPTGHLSTLTLDIKRVAGGTAVIHSQANVPVDKYRQVRDLWDRTFWKKMLKLVVE